MSPGARLELSFGEWLQVLFLFLMIMVLLVEFWLMRRRRKAKFSMPIQETGNSDEAHNAVQSTERIAGVLRAQGVDTSESDMLLEDARRAINRRDYNLAIGKANSARGSLMSAKKYSVSSRQAAKPAQDLTSLPPPEDESGPAEESGQSAIGEPEAAEKKLPDNFLQAKFMLTTAKEAVDQARRAGKNVNPAVNALKEGAVAFKAQDYGRALSMALKAKKLASGKSVSVPAEEGPVVTDVGSTVEEELGEWRASEKRIGPPKAQEGLEEWKAAEKKAEAPQAREESLACPSCGAGVSDEDAFCRKCGGKLEFQSLCPQCEAEIEHFDGFCRKCGMKLK
jgi:ribosomal protein L40E